jgi:hypothetical protein
MYRLPGEYGVVYDDYEHGIGYRVYEDWDSYMKEINGATV